MLFYRHIALLGRGMKVQGYRRRQYLSFRWSFGVCVDTIFLSVRFSLGQRLRHLPEWLKPTSVKTCYDTLTC